jgi:hypothetical protein
MVVGCCANVAFSSSQDAENVAIDIDESKIDPSNQLEYGCDNYIEKKQDESAPASPNDDSDSSEGEKSYAPKSEVNDNENDNGIERQTDFSKTTIKNHVLANGLITGIFGENWYPTAKNASEFINLFQKMKGEYNAANRTKDEKRAILYFLKNMSGKEVGEVWCDSSVSQEEEKTVIDNALSCYDELKQKK